MIIKRTIRILITVFLFIPASCITPYIPKLGEYKPMLVVEGQVTNDQRSYIVKLSLSKQKNDSVTTPVSDATVFITDETGNTTHLNETESGIYGTDSLLFMGEVGKTYQLHIKTSNGNEYTSDSCRMMPVPEIDTVYFEKDQQFLNNQTVARTGISIYLDSKPGEGADYFLRWDFEETWKFKVPFPSEYNYINDSTILTIPANEVNEYCFKSSNSSSILTGEVLSGIMENAKKIPLQFISPNETDRLTIRYSIQVNQYSISQKEFNFWNNLKAVNETNGDIFGSQPFAVLSNITNIKDPSEPVLGYFQVSAVTHKRIYINFNETLPFELPNYHYNCQMIAREPRDYQTEFGPPFTWDDLYHLFMSTPGYAFYEATYDTGGKLLKLVFTSPECADCRVTGTKTQPDFWTD